MHHIWNLISLISQATWPRFILHKSALNILIFDYGSSTSASTILPKRFRETSDYFSHSTFPL